MGMQEDIQKFNEDVDREIARVQEITAAEKAAAGAKLNEAIAQAKQQIEDSLRAKTSKIQDKQSIDDDKLQLDVMYVYILFEGMNPITHMVGRFDGYLTGDDRYAKPLMSFTFETGKGEHPCQIMQGTTCQIFEYDDEFTQDELLVFNWSMYQMFVQGKRARGQA